MIKEIFLICIAVFVLFCLYLSQNPYEIPGEYKTEVSNINLIKFIQHCEDINGSGKVYLVNGTWIINSTNPEDKFLIPCE